MQPLIIVILLVLALALTIFFLWFYLKGKKRKLAGQSRAASHTTLPSLKSLGWGSATLLGVLLARLGYMQIVHEQDYEEQAEKNRTRVTEIAAPRGRIYDRNGVELVGNRASNVVIVDQDLASNTIEMHLLANMLGMPFEALRQKVATLSSQATSATIAQDVSSQVIAYIEARPDVFANVEIEERQSRTYKNGSLAAHVLGYTASATQTQIDASQDSGNPLQVGDTVGQAGVESIYDEVLQGVAGQKQLYVDANGEVIAESETIPARPGADVTLTIDANIQAAAEQGLQHAISQSKQMGYPATAAALICLNATNGEVLALASYPTYDPAIFLGGISNDDWEALSSDASGYPMLNRVLGGTYPSASTIKPLSALAGLNNGIVTEDAIFDCAGFWTGFGSAYGQWCWKHTGHGWLNLREGIVNSCNTVFYEIGKGFYNSNTPQGLQDTFNEWGLGLTTGIDLTGEVAGRIPTPEWKESYFSSWSAEDRMWQGGDTTNVAIGQGDILVTPLQMACVYMGLANDGTIYKPHVLKSVATSEGQGTIVEHGQEVLYQIDNEGPYADFLKSALEGVIYEEDPAVAEHFATLPVKVAGKTGTAEQPSKSPTGWFCCFAPADDPQYVIAALVEEGGFGASSAMYAVRDTLGAIYDAPDTATVVSSNVSM